MSRFDVFLSYSAADRTAVEHVASKLRDAGITVFLDAWHLIPGERWGSALERALSESGACAVFFGKERGPWQDEEMYAAFMMRGTDRDFRIIPVVLPGSSSQQLPPFFRGRTWIEFSAGLDDGKTLARLIAGIRGEAPELDGGATAPIRQRIDVARYTGRETAARTHAVFHEQRGAVFVGRAAEIAEVEQFLSSRASGLLLIRGGAGSGKTTLLSRLMQSLQAPGRRWIHHLFHSESRSLTEAYLQIARQLCLHHGIDLPVFPDNPLRLRDLIYGLVEDRGAGLAATLILAIDALDEAEQPFAPMFPAKLPSGVFVIATMRDVGAAMPENLERWSEAATHRIVLQNLSRDAVGDWVRAACDSIGTTQDLDGLAARAYDVTGGYPLYTRFLIDDVASALRDGRDPLAVLSASPRGFAGYVRDQLRTLARERTLQGQKSVQRLFAILAEARGELSAVDLEVLCEITAWELQALPWEITRWLRIRSLPGGEDRFAFTHPLLAAEFSHVLGEAAKEARHALVEYCRRWREHRSPYALQHLAGHLVSDGQAAALHRLLTESPQWMEARSVAEGSISGYLSDLDLALRNLPQPVTEQWITAVLLDVSRQGVRARSAAATDEALQLLSLVGQEREAEELAPMRPSAETRFHAWLRLAEVQTDPTSKSARIAAARAAALGISEPVERTKALVAAARTARMVATEAFHELVELASADASALPPDARAQIACDLAQLADTDVAAAFWRMEAVRLAAEEPSAARPHFAVQLARIGAVEEAFSLVERLPGYRVSALEEIAESLASQGHVAQAFDALDRARAEWTRGPEGDWVNRVPRALKALLQAGAARGILDRLPTVLDDSLSWGFEPASLIASAAVAAGELPLAHAIAGRVPYAPYQGVVLAVAANAPGVPPETSEELLAEALRTWRELSPEHQRNVGDALLTALVDRERLDDALEVLGPVRESGENSAAVFRVATAAIRAGEVARAMTIIEPLRQHANMPFVRGPMISLGIELAQAGRLEEARSVAANVEHGWTAAEFEPLTGSVMAALAASLSEIGQIEAARICIAEALRLVELPHLTPFERETALMHVAAASAHAGTEDPVALARRIGSSFQRSRALIHAVEALIRRGRLHDAAEALRGVDDLSRFGDPLQTRFIRGLYEVAAAAHVREDQALVEEMDSLFAACLRSRRDSGLTALSPRPDLWVATTFDWMALLVEYGRPDRAADLFLDFIMTLSSDLQAQVIPEYVRAIEEELAASGFTGEASLLRSLPHPADGARPSTMAKPLTALPECIDALRQPHNEGLGETLAIAAYGTPFAEKLQTGLGSATIVDALRVAGWSDTYWRRMEGMVLAAVSTPRAAVEEAAPPRVPSRENLGRVLPSVRAALHGLTGDLHRDRAEWEEALTAYGHATDEDPDRSIWLLRRAWAEHVTGQFDAALRTFRQVHARWPEDAGATKGEALSLLDSGDAAAAVSAFSRPEARGDENALYWRALAHLAAGNRADFLADLTADEAAVSGPVVDALRQFWRAVAAGTAGDVDGARAWLDASRTSIAAAPPLAQRKLGGLLAAYEGNQADARAHFDVCFRNPEDPWGHSSYRTYLRLLTRLIPERDDLRETFAWFEARCPGAEAA
jgi:tetratricopeptide (TPR) repeat protein